MTSLAGGFIAANLVQNVFRGVTGSIGDSVTKAADFEQVMANIKATSATSDEGLQSLRKTALDLGMATDVGSVSAKDAANAIYELGKAGVSVEAISGGAAKAALQLAAAAGDPSFSVASAATLAADSMASFGLGVDKISTITTGLVGASNASSIGLSELKMSLAAVGPVANQIGMTFTDFSVAMAEFGMHGLKGSDAGTSLKTMLLNLSPTSSTAYGQMAKLGIITKDGANQFFDATGKVKSFADISQVLQNALKDMGQEQQTTALKLMFGTDAVRAAAIMAGEGSDGAIKYSDAVAKQGDAATTAATMSASYKGKLDALKGTFETIQISLASRLLPGLSSAADGLNTFAGSTLTALESGDWSGWKQTVGSALSGIPGIVEGAVSGVVTKVSGLATQIGPALADFGPQFVATIQNGITEAAANLPSILTSLESTRQGVYSWALDMGIKLVSWVTDAIPGLVTALAGFGVALFNWIATEGIPRTVAFMLQMADTLINWIAPAIPGMLAQLLSWGTSLLGWILNEGIPKLFELGVQLGTTLIGWIAPKIPALLEGLAEFGLSIFTWITGTALPMIVTKLVEWGGAFIDWVVENDVFNKVMVELGTVLGGVGDWIFTEALPFIVGKLSEWAGAFIDWVVENDVIGKLLNGLASMASDLFNWITGTALPSIVGKLSEWAGAFIDWVVKNDVIGKLIGGLVGMLGGLIKWVAVDALPNIIGSLAKWASEFIDWVVKNDVIGKLLLEAAKLSISIQNWITQDALPLIGTKLKEWATAFVAWGIGLWLELLPKVTSFATDIQTWINQKKDDVLGWVKGIGTNIVDGIRNGISGAWDGFMTFIHNKIMELPQAVRDFLGIKSPSRVFAEIGGHTIEGLRVGMGTGFSSVATFLNLQLGNLTRIAETSGFMAPLAGRSKPLQLGEDTGFWGQQAAQAVVPISNLSTVANDSGFWGPSASKGNSNPAQLAADTGFWGEKAQGALVPVSSLTKIAQDTGFWGPAASKGSSNPAQLAEDTGFWGEQSDIAAGKVSGLSTIAATTASTVPSLGGEMISGLQENMDTAFTPLYSSFTVQMTNLTSYIRYVVMDQENKLGLAYWWRLGWTDAFQIVLITLNKIILEQVPRIQTMSQTVKGFIGDMRDHWLEVWGEIASGVEGEVNRIVAAIGRIPTDVNVNVGVGTGTGGGSSGGGGGGNGGGQSGGGGQGGSSVSSFGPMKGQIDMGMPVLVDVVRSGFAALLDELRYQRSAVERGVGGGVGRPAVAGGGDTYQITIEVPARNEAEGRTIGRAAGRELGQVLSDRDRLKRRQR